jgi:hypothetical protein
MDNYKEWVEKRRIRSLNMKPFTLDEPISFLLDGRGYLLCNNCGDYEHHPLRFCDNCGKPLHREKNISIRDFIKITAHCGSGPINTLYYFLYSCLSIEEIKNSPKWKSDLYKEADNIYNKYDYGTGAIGKKESQKLLAQFKKEGKLTELVIPDEH